MEFDALPEECIANILCHATPADACRLCLVSKIFRSAAESDALWDHFLPSDYQSIISQSVSFIPPSSKKALYLTLCPIIFDDGKKIFQLDRRSGKKCYMLAARDLHIICCKTPDYLSWITLPESRFQEVAQRLGVYWSWTTLPESRFQQVAQFHDVCWLEIRGKIKTRLLSSHTQYAAYLVFKMIDAYGFDGSTVELSVVVHGGRSFSKNVCLDPHLEENLLDHRVQGLQRPNERSDGWLEIEMGEFFNLGLEDEDVEMIVVETQDGNWKGGLFLEGLEIRPKEDN